MSVNLSLGINPEKTKTFGPLFHTIDYDFDSKIFSIGKQKIKLGLEQIQDLIYECNDRYLRNESMVTIAGYEIEVTKHELQRIFETCENIKRTAYQRYRFFGKK